jgi:uncharacterized protein YjbI with pentapeptide repeats
MAKEFILDKEFKSVVFTPENWIKGEYDQCNFVDCNFTRINLTGCSFINCTMEACDMSNCKTMDTSFQDCTFSDCKMIGIRFEDCNPFLLKMNFEKCNLSFSSFYRLKMNSTQFKTCVLQEVDFTESDLSKSIFYGSDFLNSSFYQTNLEKTDLRETFNLILDPEQNRLKKVKISLNALPGLLNKYEIDVE